MIGMHHVTLPAKHETHRKLWTGRRNRSRRGHTTAILCRQAVGFDLPDGIRFPMLNAATVNDAPVATFFHITAVLARHAVTLTGGPRSLASDEMMPRPSFCDFSFFGFLPGDVFAFFSGSHPSPGGPTIALHIARAIILMGHPRS